MKKYIGIARALSSDICQGNLSEIVKEYKHINWLSGGSENKNGTARPWERKKIITPSQPVKQQLSPIKFKECFGFCFHSVAL